MRETFSSLHALFKCYQELKMSVTAMPSIMPQKDFDKKRKGSAMMSQSIKEEKFALICDVESFPRHYFENQRSYIKVPEKCLWEIFNCGYFRLLYPDVQRYKSWGRLANYFKIEVRRNGNLPRKLRYGSNLCNIAKDMGGKCEDYFRERGMIR